MEWHRHGVTVAMIANTAPGRTRSSPTAKPQDFIPTTKSGGADAVRDEAGLRNMLRGIFGDGVKPPADGGDTGNAGTD